MGAEAGRLRGYPKLLIAGSHHSKTDDSWENGGTVWVAGNPAPVTYIKTQRFKFENDEHGLLDECVVQRIPQIDVLVAGSVRLAVLICRDFLNSKRTRSGLARPRDLRRSEDGASSLIELAQEVGIQLAERDLAGLGDTAARCGAVANERRDDADATWAAAEVIAQLVVAHNRQVRAQQEDVDFEALSEPQQELIAAMAESPVMPGVFAREMELQPARVSRLLRDLKLAGLCRPAKHSGDQRKRPHELTPLGHEVAERLVEQPRGFELPDSHLEWGGVSLFDYERPLALAGVVSAIAEPISLAAALSSHAILSRAIGPRARAKRVSSNGTRTSRANAPV